MPHLVLRLLLVLGTLVPAGRVAAADGEPWLVIRLDHPRLLLEHELLVSVEAALAGSPDFQDRLRTPEMQRLAGAAELLESALGVDWRTALDRAARHVELRSFDVARPREAVLVVQADDRETLARLLGAVADRVAALRVLADDAAAPPTPLPPIRRLGEAFVAVDGPRLIASPVESRVRSAVGRSLETKAETPGPVLQATIALESLRDLPQVKRDFVLPGRDPGGVTLLGGWIDRLQRGRRLEIAIDAADRQLRLVGRLTSEPAADGSRIAGYFAPADESAPAPLLLPGTIYSASWYGDLAALWENRAALVQPEGLARMEKRDQEIVKELQVLGLGRRPSEVVGMLGTAWHVVVARGADSPQDAVDLEERLPRAAFAVSLRDEAAYRETLEPVFKTFGLILAGDQKLLVTTQPHGDASITRTRYRDDAASQGTGNRIRYHFSPSWTIANGHFVVGTTTSVVEDVLDALAENGSAVPGTTASSVLSLDVLADAVDDAATLAVSRAQLDQGVSSERAQQELVVLRTILRNVGAVRSRTAVTDDTVEVTLDIGPE